MINITKKMYFIQKQSFLEVFHIQESMVYILFQYMGIELCVNL